jgi:transcriptional regulator with XRE-family HTH domain
MRIREIREAADMTQPQLAVAMGVTQSAVSNWETENFLPRAAQLPLLAKVLRCDYNAMFVEQPFDGCDPDGLCDQYTA